MDMSSTSMSGAGPVPPEGASALLKATWASVAPVVRACVDPSPRAAARISSTPVGALHGALYRVCAAPPSAPSPPQPHYVYALLRAQLVIHARAVAKLLEDCGEVTETETHAQRGFLSCAHLVDEGAVTACAAVLKSSVESLPFVDSNLSSDDNTSNPHASRDALPSSTTCNSSILVRYSRLWSAFSKGLDDVAALFSYIDRVWVQMRSEFGVNSLGEDEKHALGVNLAVHDVRTTGLLAWLCEVVNPYGSRVAKAILNTVAADRASRGLDAVMLNAARKSSAAREDSASSELRVDLLKPALESFCIIGQTQASVEGLSAQSPLLSFPDGIPSTSFSGLSEASSHPDALRVPTPEREATRYALYRSLFETPFLSSVYRFYADESKAMLERATLSVREYVQSVDSLLTLELALVAKYADKSTVESARSVLERALVGDHSTALNTEANAMFRDRAVKDLRKLYALLQRTPESLCAVHLLLRSHVEADGLEALRPWTSYDSSASAQDQLDPSWLPVYPDASVSTSSLCVGGTAASEVDSLYRVLPRTPAGGFVQAAWSVYAEYAALAEDAFGTDRDFANALERGCERFVNSVRAAPELLAQFCHDLLEESLPRRRGRGDFPPTVSLQRGRMPEVVSISDGGSIGVDGSSWIGSREISWDPKVATEVAKAWIVRVTRLFRFLTDRDVFQRIYAVNLTRRLVYRTSLSQEVEEFLLDLLRETCGRDYTSRLQRMFSDISSSAVETSGFSKARSDGAIPAHDCGDAGIEVDALVLSSAAWPVFSTGATGSGVSGGDDTEDLGRTSSRLQANLTFAPNDAPMGQNATGRAVDHSRNAASPGGDSSTLAVSNLQSRDSTNSPSERENQHGRKSPNEIGLTADSSAALALTSLASLPTRIARLSASFVEYYSTPHPRHDGRKLQWMYGLCRVTMEARIGLSDVTPLRIEASLPQAAVLLQFNDHERLSIDFLSVALGVTVTDLLPVIEVLLYADILLVEEGRKGSCLSGSSTLVVNEGGTSFPLNMNDCVPLALISFHGEEKARVRKTRLGINTDRRQQVKASIVRIMKQKGTLTEAELVQLVQAKLSRWFSPREGDVIAGIAALVENEYMEPIEGGAYLYLP